MLISRVIGNPFLRSPRVNSILPVRGSSSTSHIHPHLSLISMAPKRKSDAKAGEDPDSTKKAKSVSSKKLAVGDNVSSVDATLMTQEEKEVTLSEITADNGVVIFLYPKANTGGCTKQACGFKDNYEDIKAAGFEVYGMSFDKPKSQTNWKNKYDLPYSLLTDSADGPVIKSFGAFKPPKNVIRSHIIIAKGGEVLDVQNQISPGDSFTEATEFIKNHSSK